MVSKKLSLAPRRSSSVPCRGCTFVDGGCHEGAVLPRRMRGLTGAWALREQTAEGRRHPWSTLPRGVPAQN